MLERVKDGSENPTAKQTPEKISHKLCQRNLSEADPKHSAHNFRSSSSQNLFQNNNSRQPYTVAGHTQSQTAGGTTPMPQLNSEEPQNGRIVEPTEELLNTEEIVTN